MTAKLQKQTANDGISRRNSDRLAIRRPRLTVNTAKLIAPLWAFIVIALVVKCLPTFWGSQLVGVFHCPYRYETDRDEGTGYTGVTFAVRNNWFVQSPAMRLAMHIEDQNSEFLQICFGPKREISEGKYEVKGSWVDQHPPHIDPNDYDTGWFPWPPIKGSFCRTPPEDQAVFYALIDDTTFEPKERLRVQLVLSDEKRDKTPNKLRCVSGAKWIQARLLCRRTFSVFLLTAAGATGFLLGALWWKRKIGT